MPLLSILTPFAGTPLHDRLQGQRRILEPRSWDSCNGPDVAFWPARMSPRSLLESHRQPWRQAFSPEHVRGRVARAAGRLSPGALMLTTAMNGFHGGKRLLGNEPRGHAGVDGAGLPSALPEPHGAGSARLSPS